MGLNPIIFSKKMYREGSKVAYFDQRKVKVGVIKSMKDATSHSPYVEVESQEGKPVIISLNDLYEVPRGWSNKLKRVI